MLMSSLLASPVSPGRVFRAELARKTLRITLWPRRRPSTTSHCLGEVEAAQRRCNSRRNCSGQSVDGCREWPPTRPQRRLQVIGRASARPITCSMNSHQQLQGIRRLCGNSICKCNASDVVAIAICISDQRQMLIVVNEDRIALIANSHNRNQSLSLRAFCQRYCQPNSQIGLRTGDHFDPVGILGRRTARHDAFQLIERPTIVLDFLIAFNAFVVEHFFSQCFDTIGMAAVMTIHGFSYSLHFAVIPLPSSVNVRRGRP
jgi:hypothetical protein